MENNKRRMLTIKEAARLIEGITEYRIRTMCKSGQLRSFKAGNKFLVAESDLCTVPKGRKRRGIRFISLSARNCGRH